MYLYGPNRTDGVAITTTDTAVANNKFCSAFGDALYRAVFRTSPAFNTGIVYIKFYITHMTSPLYGA